MSYTITTKYGRKIVLRNKDEVIEWLLANYNYQTGHQIKLIWPNGAYVEYEGKE